MKIEEQYVRIMNLQKEINVRLKDLDFLKTKELVLWLVNEKDFARLKNKDNQLLMLDILKNIWLEEKKRMNDFEMQGDAFWRVDSLDDVETRYSKVHFDILRIENNMPEEYCTNAVQDLITNKYSAFFIYTVIVRETAQIKRNILQLCRLIKKQNDLIKTIGLLNLGIQKYPQDEEMILELADCWIIAQQYDKAYDCLKKISEPNEMIKEMMSELEKVLGNERI